jgi:hypothetical protein
MTVGELRKALEGLPDDMPVEATYTGSILRYPANVASVEVKTTEYRPGHPCLVIEVDS